MIHLDTNYLIGLLVKHSAVALEVDGWLAAGESLAASAIAWTEFLNGPVTPLEVSRVVGGNRERLNRYPSLGTGAVFGGPAQRARHLCCSVFPHTGALDRTCPWRACERGARPVRSPPREIQSGASH